MSVLITRCGQGVRVESIEVPDAVAIDPDEQLARYEVAATVVARLFPNSIGLAVVDVIERERDMLRIRLEEALPVDPDNENSDVQRLVADILLGTAELIADGSKLGGLTLVAGGN